MKKSGLSVFSNKNFLAFSGNIFMAVMAFLLTALLTRSLSIDGYGTWVYFSMICAMGDAARNGLLITATIKFYAGTSRERGREVLGSVWFLAMAITGIFLLLDFAFLPFTHVISNEMLVISIRWFGVTFASSLPFNIIFGILVAEERYDKIFLLRMVNNTSMVVYVIVLMLLHKMTLESFLWCNLLTNCLTSVVGLSSGLGRISTLLHRSRACIKEIIHFGKFTVGTTLISRLLGSVDTNVIPFLLGPGALAVYGVVMALMGGVDILLRTFIGTGMSGMAIAYNNHDEQGAAYIFKKYSGMLTIVFIPLTLGVLVFASPAIYILGSHKYVATDAANVFRVFMCIGILYPIDRFIGATLDIIHKPRINLYKVFIMLAFAVVGDIGCVSVFKNLYGITLATFFTTLAGVIYGSFHLNKYMKFTFAEVLLLGYNELKLSLSGIWHKVKKQKA